VLLQTQTAEQKKCRQIKPEKANNFCHDISGVVSMPRSHCA